MQNKNSKLNISIITNPYCGYCKEAYLVVEKIIPQEHEILEKAAQFLEGKYGITHSTIQIETIKCKKTHE